MKEIIHSKPSFEETINEYNFLQRSGSDLSMVYDTSSTYIRMSFLPEDVNEMVDMILDVALSEKVLHEEGIQMADQLDTI